MLVEVPLESHDSWLYDEIISGHQGYCRDTESEKYCKLFLEHLNIFQVSNFHRLWV